MAKETLHQMTCRSIHAFSTGWRWQVSTEWRIFQSVELEEDFVRTVYINDLLKLNLLIPIIMISL